MTMKLKDLKPEDKISLMNEMREIIEQENIQKNATAMYAMKKKEVVQKDIEEMAHILKLKPGPEISKLKDRFVHMTNYLYSLNVAKSYNATSSVTKISTAEEWTLFEDICKKVKECMLHCVHSKNR